MCYSTPAMEQSTPSSIDPTRIWRHDVKGCMNNIVLTLEVLDSPMDPAEALEFLDGFVRSVDKLIVLMDEMAGGPGEPENA